MSLLSPFLSPAHPFVAKECGRGDRSDSGKQTFWVCVVTEPLPAFLSVSTIRVKRHVIKQAS
jgi:hypothetical protein